MYVRDLLYVVLAASTLTTVVKGHQRHRYRRQDGPVPTGTITDCTYFVDAKAGDTCASIARDWGITQTQFLDYNPSVKSDCSGLVVGDSYCVEENFGNGPAPSSTTSTSMTTTSATTTAGPSPTQSGLVANCNAFYKVVSGDYCQKIVDTYGTFTLSDFYSWNPAVGTSCGGLQAGYYVCVGVPGSSTRTSTTTTATPTGPSPTQTGIISTCTTYYEAVSGDTCEVITNTAHSPSPSSRAGILRSAQVAHNSISDTTTAWAFPERQPAEPAPPPPQPLPDQHPPKLE